MIKANPKEPKPLKHPVKAKAFPEKLIPFVFSKLNNARVAKVPDVY